jgi:hypothetical protein
MRATPIPTSSAALAGKMIAADLVAYAADCADQRVVGAGINLAAKVVDINIDNVGDRIAMHSPNLFNDGVARNRLAGMPQKEFEQRVFFGTELDRAAGAPYLVRDAVDLKILKCEHILNGTSAASQDSVCARDKFRNHKRFHQNIVGSRIEPTDALFHTGFRGEQNDRSIRPAAKKSAHRILAGQARKIRIEKNKIEGRAFRNVRQMIGMRKQLNREVFLLKPGLMDSVRAESTSATSTRMAFTHIFWKGDTLSMELLYIYVNTRNARRYGANQGPWVRPPELGAGSAEAGLDNGLTAGPGERMERLVKSGLRITMSMRRLWERPSAVELSATG